MAEKPKKPLDVNGTEFYPLTTSDQVITDEELGTRLPNTLKGLMETSKYDADGDGKVDDALHADTADTATTADTAESTESAQKLGILAEVTSEDDLAKVDGSGIIHISNDTTEGDTHWGSDGVKEGLVFQTRNAGSLGNFQLAMDYGSSTTNPMPMVRVGGDLDSSRDDWPWFRLAVGPIILTGTFKSGGWSGSPYTQTIDVSGVKSSDNPVADVSLPSDTAQAKTAISDFGLISKIETQDNKIKGTCYSDKPTGDVTVRLLIVR